LSKGFSDSSLDLDDSLQIDCTIEDKLAIDHDYFSHFEQRCPEPDEEIVGNRFLMDVSGWELSNQGDFIIYVIRVTFKEGSRHFEWDISKRFSDFVLFHGVMTPLILL